jgi:hypothetical protein
MYDVGDKVRLKINMLGNKEGTVGVCYEVYDTASASFIFENGNYDGFTMSEQEEYLQPAGHCSEVSGYVFESVIRLSKDFYSGKFKKAFNGKLTTASK